jgi:hypothetical protein
MLGEEGKEENLISVKFLKVAGNWKSGFTSFCSSSDHRVKNNYFSLKKGAHMGTQISPK